MGIMSRIVLTDGSGRWFFTSKARSWDEATRWDGHNNISCATGSQWDHEELYRTAGGVYVLHHWSQWQGSTPSYEEIPAEDAARWLSQNEHDGDDAADAGVEEQYAALQIA
jgi:hypothetical protein